MSDDHAMAVAEKLKQADETSAAAAPGAFLEFWEEGGKHHFQVEETVVLPAWARHGAVDHPAIVQMPTEQIDLRRRAADVAADDEPPLADLHEQRARSPRETPMMLLLPSKGALLSFGSRSPSKWCVGIRAGS
jgi:hypothetical protein